MSEGAIGVPSLICFTKKWAWWLVVITQSFGLAGGLLSLPGNLAGMLAVIGSGDSVSAMSRIIGGLFALAGMAISGGILYWFVTNRHLFGDLSGSTVVAIVVGMVAIVLLIPIIVIVILVLFGPALVNLFSNITINI